jgi:hypothetical protein
MANLFSPARLMTRGMTHAGSLFDFRQFETADGFTAKNTAALEVPPMRSISWSTVVIFVMSPVYSSCLNSVKTPECELTARPTENIMSP